MRAFLALENGKVFEGRSFGAQGERIGQLIFNTGMTGYQEILTDPSNIGKVVAMTYPLIGNYGITKDGFEADMPYIFALIVRDYCKDPNNYRFSKTLAQYLKENGVLGIEGIDTRALTRILRKNGPMKCIVSTDPKFNIKEKLPLLKEYGIIDPVAKVTCDLPKHYNGNGFRIAILDLGLKKSVLKALQSRGCDITVLPAFTSCEDILKLNVQGVLLPNGPGDPKQYKGIIENLKKLVQTDMPIFGIGLGHLLLALAFGADTKRLKFGHHGSYPVKDLSLDKVYITAQNHLYSVVPETINLDIAEVTHININDGSIEGIKYKNKIFSVQFMPEASPGPLDMEFMYDRFLEMVK